MKRVSLVIFMQHFLVEICMEKSRIAKFGHLVPGVPVIMPHRVEYIMIKLLKCETINMHVHKTPYRLAAICLDMCRHQECLTGVKSCSLHEWLAFSRFSRPFSRESQSISLPSVSIPSCSNTHRQSYCLHAEL